MAKKTLNEAVVRRFQKLANLAPMNEMYYGKRDDENMEEAYDDKKDHMMNEQEDEMDIEMDADMDAEKDEMDAEMDADMDADEDEMDADEDDMDIEITEKHAESIIELADMLKAAMGDEEDEENEEEMMEEEVVEEIAEADLQLSEEEVVNEVAKRVARRLAEAKKAEKQMNDALGKK